MKEQGNSEIFDGNNGSTEKRKEIPDGFVLVDKPKGITSFDVIRKLRKILRIRKMGHLGTLDPNATGLLPVCIGRATRLSQFLLHSDKRYRATIKLGQATTTFDADGEPVGDTIDPPELTQTQLKSILDKFRGTIQQVPPVYSAKKVAGKRLYEYAREGKKVEPKPCEVRIDDIEILNYERTILELEIASSSGMYVRSLAHDLGQTIGCGGYLEDLTRLQVGNLSLEDAFTLDQIKNLAVDEDFSFIQPMQRLLPGFNKVVINNVQISRIKNGNHIAVINPIMTNGEMVRLLDSDGALIAIGLVEKPLGSMQTHILPKLVFS